MANCQDLAIQQVTKFIQSPIHGKAIATQRCGATYAERGIRSKYYAKLRKIEIILNTFDQNISIP